MIKAFINNQWESIPEENLQLGAETFAYETGLYETFRTLDHRPVFLEPHLDRLFKSAQITGLKIQYARFEILEMIELVISEFPDPNQRVRILAVPEKLIVYTTSLDLNNSIYEGVSTITVKGIRETPDMKTTNYNVCLDAWTKAEKMGCFEAILTDEEGHVFEGSRSNIFWVKNSEIFTRKGDVLPGITRQTLITNSPVTVSFGKLNQNEIAGLDELFLTNSGSGVVPIIKVNSAPIGDGNPGPITQQLKTLYKEWLKNEI